MKIVRILGGLGNQMFQYALYLSMLEKGFDAKIDITQLATYKLHNGYELNRVFSIDPQIATYKEVRRLSRNRRSSFLTRVNKRIQSPKKTEYIENRFFEFDPNVYQTKTDVYLEGYWQNPEYFSNIRDQILHHFEFNIHLDGKNKSVFDNIINSNSISIHIRRGDYLKDPRFSSICDLGYYQKAIDVITDKTHTPKFFLFSDDIEWCKKHFSNLDAIFIDWNLGKNSYIDMFLMSSCKHNIIANSSFSWWSAWLNDNHQKTVISPSLWMNDTSSESIVPNEWIKI